MRLGDYYETYYVLYMADMAPSTAVGYAGDWRNHIAPEFEAWEMEEIRVRHINAWLASDHFAGIPGAARSAYKTLRQILRSAMGDELYREDVVDPTTRGIRLPRMDTLGEPQYLRPREAKELVVGLMGYEYEATALCGIWMGPRRSEQCGLQWPDLDLRRGLVHFRRGLQSIGGEVVEVKLKNHRASRPHMLPYSGIVRLREIKRERRPKRGDWLMEVPDPERYARTLRAWCKSRGLPYVAPKYFRHTFKTLHRLAGTPEEDVRKMMGHVDQEAHYRYMALDEDVLREDQRRYERLILSA